MSAHNNFFRRYFLSFVLLLFMVIQTLPAQEIETVGNVTWYPPVLLSDTTSGAYAPEITITGEDTLHIIWQNYSYPAGKERLPYVRSTDGGKTFEGRRELLVDSARFPYNANGPEILSNDSTIFVFFTGSNGSETPIRMIKSADGGVTWSYPRDITPNKTGYVSAEAIHGATIALSYDPPNKDRVIIYSTDNGVTWKTNNKVVTTHWGRIALTSKYLHLADENWFDGTFEIRYRRSSNFGDAWDIDEELTQSDGYDSGMPEIATSQMNCGAVVMVTWLDLRDGWDGILGASIFSRMSLLDGKQWLEESKITREPKGIPSENTIKSNIFVAGYGWEQAPADSFHAAVQISTSPVGQFTPTFDLTPSATSAGNVAVAVSKNTVHVVYEEYRGNRFRIFYRCGVLNAVNSHFEKATSTLSFDSTIVGNNARKVLAISNGGVDPLRIDTAVSDNPEFQITPSPVMIPSSQTALFDVQFTPVRSGQTGGKITFYHNGINSPECIDVNGIGKWQTGTIENLRGWNLVSLPFAPAPKHNFPELYTYDKGYFRQDTMQFGKGYWLKHNGNISYQGGECYSDTISVNKGWNIIGSLTESIQVGSIKSIPVGIIGSSFYSYNGEGYYSAGSIEPAHAYWVKATQEGKIILSGKKSPSRSAIVPTEK